MATVTATTWKRGYWDATADVLVGDLDNLYASLGEVFDGIEPTYVSDTYVTGRLNSGGSFAFYGTNLQDQGSATISRITIDGTGWTLDMRCQLHPSGEWVAGSVTSVDFSGNDIQMKIRGDMRLSESGAVYAFNTIEEWTFPSGIHLESETDAQGNYVRHSLGLGGNTITIGGNWAYVPVEDWRDLLAGADTLHGTSGNDLLNGYGGNDMLLGHAGTDTALFSGNRAGYGLARTAAGHVVSDGVGNDGVDTLIGIERLEFADRTVAFDIDGIAGQVYRLYQAALNRVPDMGGLGDWIGGMDNGMTLGQVAGGFIGSPEFEGLYGGDPTDAQFVDLLYRNVLHRDPETAGFDYWMNELGRGVSREQVLIGFSESTENKLALMAFGMDGHMGQVFRLYRASFDRLPDTGGLDSWTRGMDNGMTLDQVAGGFIGSPEFEGLYGGDPTDAQFVDLLYRNVLHRDPETAGFDYWMNELGRGISREQVLIGFSESIENKLSLVGIVQEGIEFA